MRYSGIIKNDFCAAPGVCVTFFTQGCPHRCLNCHNPETWDFEGGKEFNQNVINEICEALTANGIHRDFCIMGGEPLCPENEFLTLLVIKEVKKKVPDIKVYIWTGYVYETLLARSDPRTEQILAEIDVLIDGPYMQSQRDTTLPMRGSRNQRIIPLTK